MAAILTGRVFHDLNRNGQQDPSDPGIAGVTVTLYGPGGCIQTRTDGSGNYTFPVDVPGDYTIYEPVSPSSNCPPSYFTQPAGYDVSSGPRLWRHSVTALDISNDRTLPGGDFGHDSFYQALPCEARLIQFAGRPTSWYDVDLVTGTSTPRGPLTPDHAVNAIGYHPQDRYLYGYDQTANTLARIGQNGELAQLVLPEGLPAAPYNAGAFDDNGILYLYVGGAERFYAVDLRPDSATYLRLVDPRYGFAEQMGDYGIPLSTPLAIGDGDWAYRFADGALYTVQRDGQMLRVDPYSGMVTPLDTTGPNPGSPFGSLAADSAGNLYAISSADGTIYRYTIAGDSARGLRFATTTADAFSDGTLCPYALIEVDFGDAPDAGGGGGSGNYNTLLASNGPRHALGQPLLLGTQITAEEDAYQNATATGDDLLHGIQDDGLSVPLPILSVSATDYTLSVTVSNQTGQPAILYGWIDFNKNGFFELDEFATAQVPPAGLQVIPLHFTVPGGTVLQPDHTFVRLRLTTDVLDPGASPLQDERSIGPASDGEVEDYLLQIGAATDLMVTKEADLPVLHSGDTITYTITVRNQGTDPALDVNAADPLPAELSNAEYSLDQGATWLPWTGTLHLGDMAGGAVVVLLLRALFTASAATEVVNTVTVTTTSEDVNPDNNTATVITPVDASADLSVTKAANPVPAVRGDLLTYTLRVDNAGPDPAANVVLTDPAPDLENPEYSLDGALWLPWGGQYAFTQLPAGTGFDVYLRGTVPAGAPAMLTNTAQVTSDTGDPDPNNNTAVLDTPVESSADVSVVKSAAPDPVPQGQVLTYTIVVSNSGPSPAEDVTLADTLPADTQDPAYSVDGGTTWLPWQGSLDLGTLDSGDAVQVLLRVTVSGTAAGRLDNRAQVTSPTPDPDPSNNESIIETEVAPSADLSVVKTASPDPAVAGEALTYTIAVANAGPAQAEDVTLYDDAPAGLAAPAYSLDNGTTWLPWSSPLALGALPAGDTVTLLLRGTVAEDAVGSLVNTAQVTSTTYDPDEDNNSSTVVTPVGASADVSIRKMADHDPVTAGETLTYTIQVANAGPSTAQDVAITDGLPAVLAQPAYSVDGGATWLPWQGHYPMGPLAAGAAFTLLLRGVVEPAAQTTIENTARVTASTPDPDPSNNESTAEVVLTPSADLSVLKTASPDPVSTGDWLTYTLTVSNAGPADAQDVVLTDALPTGLIGGAYSADGGATWLPWQGSLSLGTLASGAAVTILLRGVVTPQAQGTLTNTAAVAGSTHDPDPTNNESTTNTAVDAQADLSVVKSAQPDPAQPGAVLTYTVTVHNAGPADAQGVSLTDPLPPQLTAGEFSTDGGATWQPWQDSLALGTLAAGADASILLRGMLAPGASGTLENTARVGSDTPDPDPDNNEFTLFTPITAAADLAVTKQAPALIQPGQPLTYTILVENRGPDEAQDVLLADPLPAQLGGAEFSVDGGASWQPWQSPYRLGALAAGASATVLLRSTVDAGAAGVITNTATVSSSTGDPDPDNNTSTTHTAVGAAADLSVTKSAAPDPAVPGGPVTYTVTARNAGPSEAVNVVLRDAVPAALLAPEYSTDGGATWAPWQGTYQAAALPAGGAITLLLRGTIAPDASGTLRNAAVVGSDTPDPNPDDNEVEVETPLIPSADLSIVKTAGQAAAAPGETLVYTLRVRNLGPSDAAQAEAADPLPALLLSPEYSADGGATWLPWQGSLPLGTLAAGAEVQLLLRGVVSPAATGVLHNRATVTSPTPDPDPSNNSSRVETPVEPAADLWVSKSAAPDPVTPGATVTFTLAAGNAGPASAGDVSLADDLPDTLTGAEFSVDGGATWLPWQSPYPLGTVQTGEQRQLLIRARLSPSASGTLPNTAAITSPTPDPDPSNNSSSTVTPIEGEADLSIRKSAAPDPVTPGQPLTYTLTVHNSGPSDAHGVTVTDLAAGGLLNPQFSTDQGAAWQPWPGAYPLGTLAAGATFTLLLRGTVPPAALAPVANAAAVTAATPDPDPTNNTDTTVTPVAPSADLAVRKSAEPTPAVPGQPLLYRIQMENRGPSDAHHVTLIDALPRALHAPEYSLDNGHTWQHWAGRVSLPVLAAGSTALLLLRGTLDGAATGSLRNTAVIVSRTPDPHPDSNRDTIVTPVQDLADLSIRKSARPSPAVPGGWITYRLVAANAGPAAAQDVVLSDAVAGAEYSLDRGATWQPWAGSYQAGTLQAGAVLVLLLRLRVPTGAQHLTNTASIASSTPDPDPTNNTFTLETPVAASADLSIAKTASPSPAVPGQPLYHTIIIRNAGPADAQDVVIRDTAASGDFSLDGGITWQPWPGAYPLGSLAADAAFSLQVRTLLDPAAAGSVRNTASVESSTPDPHPEDNSVTVETPVSGTADLSVTKRAQNLAVPGEPLVYAITVSNGGPATAENVVVGDMAATGDYSSDGGITWQPWPGSYFAGALRAGEALTLLLRVQVPADAQAEIQNTATVTSTTPDPHPEDNSFTLVTPLYSMADLSLCKSACPHQARRGQYLIYTLRIYNAGPSAAHGVVLEDAAPRELCYAQFTADEGLTWEPWGGRYELGDLAAGECRVIYVAGVVDPCACGPIRNTACVRSLTPDPDPANNAMTIETILC